MLSYTGGVRRCTPSKRLLYFSALPRAVSQVVYGVVLETRSGATRQRAFESLTAREVISNRVLNTRTVLKLST